MFSASSTRSVFRCVFIDQPTTRRLHASTTTARYRKPFDVGMYVMSATQSWSRPSTLKSRSMRSGAGRASLSRFVVRHFLRRVAPCRPASRIRRCTRLWLTRQPSFPELGPHPRLAVRLSAEAVDLTHPTQQSVVIDRPRRGWTVLPRVIAAGGDTQDFAHHPHAELRLVGRHELERLGGTESVS